MYNPEGEDGETSEDGEASSDGSTEDGVMPLEKGMVDESGVPGGTDMMEGMESSEEDTSDGDGANEADTNEGQDSEQEPEG